MMHKGRYLFLMVGCTLAVLLRPSLTSADVRRERTERRPYVVEVGEPYSITMPTLRNEGDYISELHSYLSLYGYPEFAEVQEIEPEWPWESYEVRLYYLRRNLEIDFGHVFVDMAMPNYGVLKYQGDIPADKRHEIEVILESRVTPPPPPPLTTAAVPAAVVAPPAPSSEGLISEAVLSRLEAAAERAAQAADRATTESEAAARAAERTESIVSKMEESVSGRGRR